MTIYSYSRINTFFTCPAQFQFRYIEKRPSPAAEGIELFLGSRFHETMEHLYQQVPRQIPNVNELVDFFKNHWQNHWNRVLQKQKDKHYPETLRIVHEGQTVEDYYQKGLLFVENYYHQYHPFDQDRTEGIELKVAFDLDPQGQYKMQGFIDRLGRDEEGTLWIHDYKTSSRKMSVEDARNEDQLALYQAGLLQNPRFGAKETIKLIWHFVAFEKDQVIGERNPKEIGWLKEKYISKIQTIEKAKSFPTKTGILCKWCEYLSVCTDGQKWVESRKKEPVVQEEAAVKPLPEKVLSSVALPESTVSETVPNRPSALQTHPEVISALIPSTLSQSPKKKKSSQRAVSPDQLKLF